MPDAQERTPPENYKLAAVSTACLLPATSERMEREPKDFPFIVAPFTEGFFVSCSGLRPGDECPMGVPADLHALRTWAVEGGYQYLLVDRDAEVPDGCEDYSGEWK